jgi:hypothetical protein
MSTIAISKQHPTTGGMPTDIRPAKRLSLIDTRRAWAATAVVFGVLKDPREFR